MAAYIRATQDSLPGWEAKIAFDKFHVAKYLGDAVDKVRRHEHKALAAQGRTDLKGTRHRWLTNPEHMRLKQWREFKALREITLETARAWAMGLGDQ